MLTDAELRDQKLWTSFTGREEELESFREWVATDVPLYVILNLYGIGGVGKSALLRCFRRICSQWQVPVVLIDLKDQPNTLWVMRAIRKGLGHGSDTRTAFRALALGLTEANNRTFEM